MTRLNIGCGQTPTPGWKNYDNSWSVRLGRHKWLTRLLQMLGVLGKHQRQFVAFARDSEICYADAAKRIPETSSSVQAIYTSHMMEHLDRSQVRRFLGEARRVLVPGGIMRIAVPDIAVLVDDYLKTGDADRFVQRTGLSLERPRSVVDRLRLVIAGPRNHHWMYDGKSLCKLLSEEGFQDPQVFEPGHTRIPDEGPLNLREREGESVYVEAVTPNPFEGGAREGRRPHTSVRTAARTA